MSYEFQITRRVEFSETDLAGIMHFSNFFRFMESAEHAFWRSLGFSVTGSRNGVELCLRLYGPAAVRGRGDGPAVG